MNNDLNLPSGESTSNPSGNNILYHYTSVNIIQKILEGIKPKSQKSTDEPVLDKPFVLRGTHIQYLNDTAEMNLAAKVMSDSFNEHEEKLNESENKHIASELDSSDWEYIAKQFNFLSPFVTAFSKNPDSLPMWNTYGRNGTGVAIGIDKEQISNITAVEYNKPSFKKKIVFEIEEIYNRLSVTEKTIKIDGLLDFKKFTQTLCSLKDAAYEYEEEWRIIESVDTGSNRLNRIKFQEFNGLLKPYIENVFSREILKEIWIGPCADLLLSLKSIKLCLHNSGYLTNKRDKDKSNYVRVELSKVPYRNI